VDVYSIEQHRHQFAVWAAARAVQRGFAGSTTDAIETALGSCGVREDIANGMDVSDYDECHSKWCDSVMQSLNSSYGQAAKVIAIYVKATLVIPHPESALACVAHPPIDSFVLKNLMNDARVSDGLRQFCAPLRWTQMDKDLYVQLIKLLRSEICVNGTPFWHLERYFTATGELHPMRQALPAASQPLNPVPPLD
jgi:hypothetical protein